MNDKITQLTGMFNSRFSWVNDVTTLFNSMEFSDTTGGLDNIAVLPIVGDITVIDFSFLNQHASFIRGLCSCFVYFLIGVYIVRTAPTVLGLMS